MFKTVWLIVIIALLFSVPGLASDRLKEYDAGTSSITITFDYLMYCFAVKSWDADCVVICTVEDGTFDTLTVELGSPEQVMAPCNSIEIVRSTSTRVSVRLGGPYGRGGCPSFASAPLNTPDIEWVSAAVYYNLPDSTFMTFPAPLIYAGGRNAVAFSIYTSASPDTIWIQLVASAVPFDTMTVFNWGSADDPINTLAIPWARVTSGTALEYLGWLVSLPYRGGIAYDGSGWTPDAVYSAANPNMYNIADANGNGLSSRYVGIRVSGGDTALTLLNIWIGLAKIGAVGG